ncbi:Purine nucleoside phosphorylase [Trichoplax sp. H2]|uniref:Purine nucleoside phosphorylase n=1 Tax=Trichoplax adhaerens TaxID=10228 RepID=B3RV48_TRIAD|nr:hypothetical protein TRIADDRAFT_55525 [Trichoplax adhaerens]EDV25436.1 hypothetical protein TRIADDRAFT_55525 [Trichoplax adhaerens]RDD44120.1 Purine nucleoside phosphorylase [Trichoplax sp. H2]|eukprot:XP_002111469.1 hypothetical protein TRIADDRAFT_55525 [Trichoplax adhaerens]
MADVVESYSYEDIEAISKFLLERCRHRPKIGIICGSGLGGLADTLQEQEAFPYESIPKFPVSTVSGHKGRLVFGVLSGKAVVCMQGRFHMYEGYSMAKVTLPVRVMKLLGVETMLVTNAAGGVNQDYVPGDIMIIKDHINFPGLCGNNPLRGPNNEKFGPRFPAMNDAYNAKLRASLRAAAKLCGLSDHMKEGVYAYLGGPAYETVAELRFLKAIGVDAVGMSTAPEVIVARHCGMKVCGLSLISNKGIMEYDPSLVIDHSEVLEAGRVRAADIQSLVSNLVKLIDE